jgi:hypothetical protein
MRSSVKSRRKIQAPTGLIACGLPRGYGKIYLAGGLTRRK